jgi:hypothetical protein
MNGTADAQRAKIESEWDDLFFGVKRSVRYHLHRRKFFERWKLIANFLVIASGGTVITVTSSGDVNKSAWLIGSGIVVAIVGTLDLVIGFSDKVRDQRDFVKAFSDLEAEMTEDSVTKTRLVEFTNKRLKLEVDEPPIMHVLNKFCHNELVIAMGYPLENLAEIQWWQRLSMQYIDVLPERIKTAKQVEEARLANEKARAVALASPKPS